MRLGCLPCWRLTGAFVPAVNVGDVARCERCAERVWEALGEHGASGGAEQVERQRREGVRR